MEDVFNIPLPNFQFSEFVERKAKDFYGYRLRNLSFDNFKIKDRIQSELYGLNKEEHRIQFIGYLLRNIFEDLNKHKLVCRGGSCGLEQNAQEVLYFLYGKIEESGIIVDIESFSLEEIITTNNILNEINSKLDFIKTGEELLYDEIQEINENVNALKEEIQSLKGLYPLGKKKWKELLGGIILENMTNKSMTEVLKTLQPYFSQLIPYIKELLLLK